MNRQDALQPMFHYSPAFIIIILLIIGYIIYLIIKNSPKKKEKPVIVEPKKVYKSTIKNNYKKKLNELEKELNEDKITTRKAYQKLSMIIRNFVYETTNIKVQYYTLEEIRPLNMDQLTKLVEEYYVPEFAKDSTTKIETSLKHTREVIEQWQ